MAQPTPYEVDTDFSQDEVSGVSGRSTVRTPQLDAEFSNIALSISQLRTNLGILQRDDGELADGIVKLNSISAAVLLMLGSQAFTIPSTGVAWGTGRSYVVKNVVTNGTGTYFCAVAHTSGTFATDLAAAKWVTVFDSVNYVASAVSFTPTGTIAATNVQSAIAEAASDSLTFTQDGIGAVARTTHSKFAEVVSVLDFMTAAQIADVTSYTGSIDLQSVFTAALAVSKRIFCPPGAYKLATAVELSGGEEIVGVNGVYSGSTGRTIIKPTTVAFKSSLPTTQLQEVSFVGLGFQGGTNPIDLALFHRVRVHDCQLWDFTGCGIVIVRGERHYIERVEFVLAAALCDAPFALGDYTKSVDSAALSGVAFGSPGQWIDRITIHNVNIVGVAGSATFNWGYAIWSGASNSVLSGMSIDNFVAHGGTTAIMKATKIQHSDISNIQVDSLASGALPTTAAAFDIGTLLNVTFRSTNPGFAGNVDATVMFEMATVSRATFIDCKATGNNSTTYGFRFGAQAGQSALMLGCSGAIFHQNSNAIIRNQISCVDCTWTNSNLLGNTAFYQPGDANINFHFISDLAGATATTGKLTTSRTTGGGGSRVEVIPRNHVASNIGDSAVTLTVGTSSRIQIYGSPITADRAVTLSTTGAQNGDEFIIVRKAAATGAFNVNVGTGPLKAMGTPGSVATVTYDGSAWILTGYEVL